MSIYHELSNTHGFLYAKCNISIEGGDILTKIEKSIEIRAPPEKIWSLLFWDKLPEWLDTITKAEYTSKDKDRVGATAHAVSEAAGIKAEWDVEITEYVKNVKATWRTTAGNFTAIGLTTLNPTKAGTKVSFVIDYGLPYSILGKIIDKLKVSREIENDVEKGLKKLKNIVEK